MNKYKVINLTTGQGLYEAGQIVSMFTENVFTLLGAINLYSIHCAPLFRKLNAQVAPEQFMLVEHNLLDAKFSVSNTEMQNISVRNGIKFVKGVQIVNGVISFSGSTEFLTSAPNGYAATCDILIEYSEIDSFAKKFW